MRQIKTKNNTQKIFNNAIEARTQAGKRADDMITTKSGETRTASSVYEQVAEHIHRANTTNSQTEYIKSRFQMEETIAEAQLERDEGIAKMRAALLEDTEAEKRFASVSSRVEYAQREFKTTEARKVDPTERVSYTPEKRAEYIRIASAVEALTDSTGTLSEQIEAITVLEGVTNSEDVGIRAILRDKFDKESIGEIKTYLSVEAINNYDELQGSALQKQVVVDNAIREVKARQTSSGVYEEILSKLDFNPDRLEVGNVPIRTETNRPENKEVFVPSRETPETAAIRRALEQNNEEMEIDPIYRVGSSYNTEREGRKLKKKIVKLSADIGKEVATDVGGVIGGTLGLSAELAVDKSYSAEEMVTSTFLGSSIGSGAVGGTAEVITKVNKTRKKIQKGLRDYGTSDSPIVRFDDQGRVIRDDNQS